MHQVTKRTDKVVMCWRVGEEECHWAWQERLGMGYGYRNNFPLFDYTRQKELVLRTWSGILMNEDSLPDNWLYTSGVLVGMQPVRQTEGIG